MKRIILCLSLFAFFGSQAQQINPVPDYVFSNKMSVGRNAVTDTAAYFSIGPRYGAIRGMMPPMVTDTASMSATKRNGLLIFSIQKNKYLYWDSVGSKWAEMAGTAGSAITGSGVAGYMPEFTTATNIDTTRLYHSNGRFAIGSTTTTNGVFNVYGGNMYADSTTTLSNLFRVDDARQQVGIGTNTPFDEIDIIGRVRIQDTGVAAPNNVLQLIFRNSSDGGNQIRFSNSATDDLVSIYAAVEGTGGGTDDGVFRIHTTLNGTSSERMRVTSNGEVNIGSSSDAGNYTLQNYGGLYSTSTTILAATGGNVGVGITPSAWSTLRGLQNGVANISGYTNNIEGLFLTNNAFYNGSNWIYQTNAPATVYYNLQGEHVWGTSTSGTAGNSVSYTYNMKLNSSSELLIGTTTDAGAYALQVAGSIYNTTGAVLAASSGNVGIGTTSPGYKLQVSGTGYFSGALSTAGQLRLEQSAFGSIVVGSRSSQTDFQLYNTSNVLRIYNGSEDVLNINTSNNVGIGTTSPAYKLDVNGTGYFGSGTTDNQLLLAFPQDYKLRYRQRISSAYGFILDSAAHEGLFLTSFEGGNHQIFMMSDGQADKNVFGFSVSDDNGSTYVARFVINQNGSIGVGTNSPNASAIVDVTSTTKGFLPPRMTSTQRDAISSPAAGLIIYNTTTSKLQVYTTSWTDLH